MTAPVLMMQGTCSSAGKSALAAALCRIFARRGLRVAPFKAQNMSNNAAVCADGSEIGRSQALQAHAAGLAPTADMNPVLLKPEADAQSQVILNGRPWRRLRAREYYQHRETLWPVVTAALDRLRRTHDLVIAEGAGSPAELNLSDREIVNMRLARHAGARVLLVGNIELGGIFAQLLGTLWLLDEPDRALVHGFIVNRFRGDPTLFADGRRILEHRGEVPVLGVVPELPDLALPDEDAATLRPSNRPAEEEPDDSRVDVAVIRLTRIANFDDFTPLETDPTARLRYVDAPDALGTPDAVILPGTKSTASDLLWLRQRGLADAIHRLAHRGTTIVGICGGYQMLGEAIHDPLGVESEHPMLAGLGLLPVASRFEPTKQTHQAEAHPTAAAAPIAPGCTGERLTGYEIHMAQTDGGTPWLDLKRNGESTARPEGATTPDGRVWGCYLHGLFANPDFRRSWLAGLGASLDTTTTTEDRGIDASLDRLADAVEAALDVDRLAPPLPEHPAEAANIPAPASKEPEP